MEHIIAPRGKNWHDALIHIGRDRDLVWRHYDHLERLETRYAMQMERLRLLASSWFIATSAAVGFILFQNGTYFSAASPDGPVLPPALVALCVVTAGAFGTFLLWSLDALVYRSLFAATYWEAIQLERTTAFLMPVRQEQARLSQTFHKGVAGIVSIYYLAMIVVQMLVASALVALWSWNDYSPASVWLHVLVTALIVLLLKLLQDKVFSTSNWTTFEKREMGGGGEQANI